jgi:hypothetical protein
MPDLSPASRRRFLLIGPSLSASVALGAGARGLRQERARDESARASLLLAAARDAGQEMHG